MLLFFRILNGSLFSYCIFVQWNDPDPFIWMVLYSLPIFWTIFPPNTPSMMKLARLNALFYLFGSLWLFPSEFHGLSEMKDEIPEIEEAREALGLLLASIGVFVTGWFVKREQEETA